MQVTSAMTKNLKDSKAIFPHQDQRYRGKMCAGFKKTHSLNAERNIRGTEDGEGRESNWDCQMKEMIAF